jgi:mannitol/fructose-specific phosphotransferase system IIA component
MNGCFNIDLIGATLVSLNKVKKAPCVCVCERERLAFLGNMVLIPKGCYMLSYYLTKSWVFQRCINIFIEQEDKRETHISHDQLVIEKLDQ